MSGDGSSWSCRWMRRLRSRQYSAQVLAVRVQRSRATGNRVHSPPARLAPGRPALDDRQVPGADVAFHPDPIAGMPGNALPASAADAGDAGFRQSWHLASVPDDR